MNRMLTTVFSLILVVGAGILLMRMLGLGDVVANAGNLVREKAGLPKQRAEFAAETLGWNIQDIDKKPVTVVRDGLRRVEKVIDELTRDKHKVGVVGFEAGDANEEAKREMTHLESVIRKAMGLLKDETAQYPVSIEGMLYADQHQLLVAVQKAQNRYTALKGAATLRVNNRVRSEGLRAEIEERLSTAYAIKEVLEARLSMAETQEISASFGKSKDALKDLSIRAKEIISDEETSEMPGRFGGGDERMKDNVLNFNF